MASLLDDVLNFTLSKVQERHRLNRIDQDTFALLQGLAELAAGLSPSGSVAGDGITIVGQTVAVDSSVARKSLTLAQFAGTTSAQLAALITDETGTGPLAFANGSAINPTSTGATTPGTMAFTRGTLSGASAASTPAIFATGTIFTGGTGTTTMPHWLIQPAGTAAATTWATAGTWLGINAPSGFAGNFLDCHVNGGASVFSVTSSGALNASGTIIGAGNIISASGSIIASASGGLVVNGRLRVDASADGFGRARNSGNTANASWEVDLLKISEFTVAALALKYTAASSKGAKTWVNDATVAHTGANIGTTVAGGGANFVPVYSNGTNWVIG